MCLNVQIPESMCDIAADSPLPDEDDDSSCGFEDSNSPSSFDDASGSFEDVDSESASYTEQSSAPLTETQASVAAIMHQASMYAAAHGEPAPSPALLPLHSLGADGDACAGHFDAELRMPSQAGAVPTSAYGTWGKTAAAPTPLPPLLDSAQPLAEVDLLRFMEVSAAEGGCALDEAHQAPAAPDQAAGDVYAASAVASAVALSAGLRMTVQSLPCFARYPAMPWEYLSSCPSETAYACW